MIDYENYNANPKDRITSDCVVRAMTLATGKDYDTVYKEMVELSLKCRWFINDKHLEDKYLEQCGFVKMKQPRKPDGKKYKIKEIDEICDCEGPVVIRCAHHLTCVKAWCLYDIWNCGYKTINNYYVKK